MMNKSRLETDKKKMGDNIMKDIRYVFRLRWEIKEIDYIAIKDMRNHFRLKEIKSSDQRQSNKRY